MDGQDISWKSERKNPWFTLSALPINCVCQSISSMFVVLGIYNCACFPELCVGMQWPDVIVLK